MLSCTTLTAVDKPLQYVPRTLKAAILPPAVMLSGVGC